MRGYGSIIVKLHKPVTLYLPLSPFILMTTRENLVLRCFLKCYSAAWASAFFFLTVVMVAVLPSVPQGHSPYQLRPPGFCKTCMPAHCSCGPVANKPGPGNGPLIYSRLIQSKINQFYESCLVHYSRLICIVIYLVCHPFRFFLDSLQNVFIHFFSFLDMIFFLF